jgi:hypothetical protein
LAFAEFLVAKVDNQRHDNDSDDGEELLIVQFHFFSFSPSATKRRMACARVIALSADDAIHASMAASSWGCQRSPTWIPRPVVAGLPRFFLVVTRIDFAMN